VVETVCNHLINRVTELLALVQIRHNSISLANRKPENIVAKTQFQDKDPYRGNQRSENSLRWCVALSGNLLRSSQLGGMSLVGDNVSCVVVRSALRQKMYRSRDSARMLRSRKECATLR
jgi:hypothetical protein